MTNEQKKELLKLKEQALNAIYFVKYCIVLAEATTAESDGMTADYIWGNCTLEQLEAHLESVKVEA